MSKRRRKTDSYRENMLFAVDSVPQLIVRCAVFLQTDLVPLPKFSDKVRMYRCPPDSALELEPVLNY